MDSRSPPGDQPPTPHQLLVHQPPNCGELVFFLHSVVLWTLSRPSHCEEELAGVAASPWPHSFTLSSPSSLSVSADYWIYLISFFSSVHLLTFFPSTNTQMRWELDTISSWFRHWLQRNFLPSRINSNVLTQPLKHSTSAEINTAEHCGLKHWIVKVD